MQTLDIFRASVAGAALGIARRALAEAVAHARRRQMFARRWPTSSSRRPNWARWRRWSTPALLTYRAAWLRDEGEKRRRAGVTAEAAMAKMTATENAQRVIDMALQMHGGLGVEVGKRGKPVPRHPPLRIYEGATEVQQLIIGKSVLRVKP